MLQYASGFAKSRTVSFSAARFAATVVELLLLLMSVVAECQSGSTETVDAIIRIELSEQTLPGSVDEMSYMPAAVPANPSIFKMSNVPRWEAYRQNPLLETIDKPPPSALIHVDLTPLFARMNVRADDIHFPSSSEQPERYHWRGLFLQSLTFLAFEDTVRMVSDGTMRSVIATKPYWHDYLASMQQFNMRRWNDGDAFIVNYIGHGMHGAIASYIEIQNSPHDRSLRIGASRAYWKSRFVAMLWSTVYSTQSEIGPLGEAAIGNEGGYTYPLGCKSPCPSYKPGDKYTNNTGWVDFIITPTVGTLWVVVEDTVDRVISDRVQNGRPDAVFPKILRGGLNPSRTVANALRFKKPWYRDFQHSDVVNPPTVHFVRSDEEERTIRNLLRFEIFPHFNALSLPVNSEQCAPCRHITTGAGIGFSYRLFRWLDLDSDVNYQPEASPLPTDRAGGSIISGTFGFRSGIQTKNYALKASIRPGFVSYDHAYMIPPNGYTIMLDGPPAYPDTPPVPPELGRITHFATALSINADYGLTRHFALRASFGNTPVRYKTNYLDRPPGRGAPPYLYFISPNVFATNENWTYQLGPVLRF